MKVLCHEGSRTAKLNALHESVVCAHVQHPNVVSHFLPYCCVASRPGAVHIVYVQHEVVASNLIYLLTKP